jgi:triphosphatase
MDGARGHIEPFPTERTGHPSAETAVAAPARSRGPALALDDTMAEAARKVLARHWERARKAEPGARGGVDIEHVHDMRVALRRMRVALRIFAGYLDRGAFRPFRKRLRRTARRLGAVRDLDVFHEKTRRYLGALDEQRHGDLDALLDAWRREHARARRRLITWLDSDAYGKFASEFDDFLRGRDGREGRSARRGSGTHRVRDEAPLALLAGWAAVRAHDRTVSAPHVAPEELHRVRIACKRLRYTLEFFSRVLGPGADPLIGRLTQIQDHLGDLQDAVVAGAALHEFLASGGWSGEGKHRRPRPLPPAAARAVTAYVAARQREASSLVESFPRVWAAIPSTEFKREMLELIADW